MRKNTGKTPMSELLQKLTRSCFVDRDALDVARTQAALWQTWLLPVTANTPVGEDRLPRRFPAYPRRDEQTFRRGYGPHLPACRIPAADAGKRRAHRHLLHLGATAPRR